MSDPTRDPLDQAIDRVAARLVSVDHDRAMVERIVAGLPERNGVAGWLRVLVPQAALATVLIVGAWLWMTGDREQVLRDPVAAPSVAEAGAAAREGSTVPAPSAIVNATLMAALRESEAAPVLTDDHERSLAHV